MFFGSPCTQCEKYTISKKKTLLGLFSWRQKQTDIRCQVTRTHNSTGSPSMNLFLRLSGLLIPTWDRHSWRGCGHDGRHTWLWTSNSGGRTSPSPSWHTPDTVFTQQSGRHLRLLTDNRIDSVQYFGFYAFLFSWGAKRWHISPRQHPRLWGLAAWKCDSRQREKTFMCGEFFLATTKSQLHQQQNITRSWGSP